eukprot:TRINITY_DN4697_c2_g3_i1.p3 TRINITY_DN4697_c2_g3~~TRINITY_DN4697_c2_g3_i1.p3  ORF type:complete len:309 (+),score=75.02 TRINITY_DN4697_c2_g3_i1:98-928(+)
MGNGSGEGSWQPPGVLDRIDTPAAGALALPPAEPPAAEQPAHLCNPAFCGDGWELPVSDGDAHVRRLVGAMRRSREAPPGAERAPGAAALFEDLGCISEDALERRGLLDASGDEDRSPTPERWGPYSPRREDGPRPPSSLSSGRSSASSSSAGSAAGSAPGEDGAAFGYGGLEHAGVASAAAADAAAAAAADGDLGSESAEGGSEGGAASGDSAGAGSESGSDPFAELGDRDAPTAAGAPPQLGLPAQAPPQHLAAVGPPLPAPAPAAPAGWADFG